MVVRGGDLSEEEIRRDALRTRRRSGEYGVSVLGAPSERALDEIAREVLVRFEVLTVLTAIPREAVRGMLCSSTLVLGVANEVLPELVAVRWPRLSPSLWPAMKG